MLPAQLDLSADENLIVYGILFLGVLLLVESAVQLLTGHRFGPEARINRRLRMLQAGIDPREVLRRLRPSRYRKPDKGPRNPIAWLDWMLASAGLQLSPMRLFVIMAGVAMIVAAGLWSIRLASPGPALAIGLAAGVFLPLVYIRALRQKRIRRFGDQLPEAIDLIVRSLRAGHPLSAGLRMVAEEMPDPVGTEFGIVVDETTYGLELEDAIRNATDRIALQDLQFLAMAIRIHHSTGGNLAEVLDNLAKLIRSRLHMFRKVRAITAEGRLSAWFLSLFPVAMGLFMVSVKPTYYAPITEDPMFPWVAGITVTLLILNIVMMRWMVAIKV